MVDVAADADPNTGVASYDSYGEPGWLVFGGTSVSSPIIASVYALAGNASTFTNNEAQALYSAPTLHKVTEGSNARRCSVYLCNAKNSLSLVQWVGYNGPTGEGTPNGIIDSERGGAQNSSSVAMRRHLGSAWASATSLASKPAREKK